MSKFFTMDRYLRNRPFFVLYFSNGVARKTTQQKIAEAINPTETKTPLYNGNPDTLKQLSRYELVDRVSSKHEREASVILDVVNMKLVKNSSGADHDETMAYLSGTYEEEITKAMDAFIQKRARELRQQGVTAADLIGDEDDQTSADA